MELIRDDEDLDKSEALPAPNDKDEPVARLAPPDDEDSEENESSDESSGGPAWLRPLGAILAAIIILFLLAIFARWIYGEVTGNNSPSNKGATNQGQAPAAPGPNSSKNGAGNTPNNSSTPTGTANKNGQLPNNGPGNVAAIFVASSLAAAGLHFIIRLRRFSHAENQP